MTSPFVYELAAAGAAVSRAKPGDSAGFYALPWYLVIGEPGSGRTTAVRSMQMEWPGERSPLPVGLPETLCTYWLSSEALIIEPEAKVLGPARQPNHLKTLCSALHKLRPREPVDGILLAIDLVEIANRDEAGIEEYAARLRSHLVDAGKAFQADVPVYIIATRYDVLWGFADVFQWGPERKGEEPWGFNLPGDTTSQKAAAAIDTAIDGLAARFELFCLAKVSSEAPPDQRTRAFQHLAEVRSLLTKLRQFFRIVAMANAFERAPWIRSLIIGSAIPGTGDRPRAGVARFANMGLDTRLALPPGGRPGGLPIHAFLQTVVIPERELVPTKVRWRDDRATVITAVAAIFATIAAMIVIGTG